MLCKPVIDHRGAKLADVGGFFRNPDTELLERWYQLGSFQPFFRAHAHIDTKRREPWLFGEAVTTRIREVIRDRYRLLPFWYTLFQEWTITNLPPMRPMVLAYPSDEASFGIDDQFMLGQALVVKGIYAKDTKNIDVYLPKQDVSKFHRLSPEIITFQSDTYL